VPYLSSSSNSLPLLFILVPDELRMLPSSFRMNPLHVCDYSRVKAAATFISTTKRWDVTMDFNSTRRIECTEMKLKVLAGLISTVISVGNYGVATSNHCVRFLGPQHFFEGRRIGAMWTSGNKHRVRLMLEQLSEHVSRPMASIQFDVRS
jgi:hypothetical protein